MKKLLFIYFVILVLPPVCFSQVNQESEIRSDFSFADSRHKNEERSNKETALAVLQAFGTGNIDFIMQHISRDGIDYGEGSFPPVRGKDSIRASLTAWLSYLENYKPSNPLTVAEGNYVFVYADWAGTFKVDFMGLPTKGKSFKIKDVDIFRFDKKGKIMEHRAVQSINTILSQVTTAATTPVTMVTISKNRNEIQE